MCERRARWRDVRAAGVLAAGWRDVRVRACWRPTGPLHSVRGDGRWSRLRLSSPSSPHVSSRVRALPRHRTTAASITQAGYLHTFGACDPLGQPRVRGRARARGKEEEKEEEREEEEADLGKINGGGGRRRRKGAVREEEGSREEER